MVRMVSSLLALVVLAISTYAQPPHNWAEFEKVKKRTPLTVLLWTGERIDGRIERVDVGGLQVSTFDFGSERYLERTRIWRIVRIPRRHLPNPGKWMLISAVSGGAIGATSGAIADARSRTPNGRWFTGGLIGAGLGFLGACAVMAGIGAVDVGSDVAHRNKVLYESRQMPPAPPEQAATDTAGH